MNPFSVQYYPKIEQKLYTADWEKLVWKKIKTERFCTTSGNGIDLIKNESMH